VVNDPPIWGDFLSIVRFLDGRRQLKLNAALSSTRALAKSDTAFPNEAIQINLAEISVGDLAQKNGGSDDVKSFGKMLVDDHTASNTKATSLAQSKRRHTTDRAESCRQKS
jgi:predicted outer membrane protein